MWCVIPAAGRGTRLGPLAQGRPKPLLPVAGRPLLLYVLDRIPSAVTRVCLVVGPEDGAVRQAVGDRHGGRPIRFVTQRRPRGVAHAVARARGVVEGSFLVVMGDVWYERPIDGLVQAWRRSGADGAVLVEPVRSERQADQPAGIVRVRDGSVVGLEKRGLFAGDELRVAGAMLLPQAAFGTLETAPSARSGEYELEDAVTRLLDGGCRFVAVRCDGSRRNINTAGDLAAVEARIAAGRSRSGAAEEKG